MNTTFGVGNVLATGFRIWFRNIIPFLVITGLFYLPLWLWALSVTSGEVTSENLNHATTVVAVTVALAIPINTLVSAALTYGVVMELQGQRASFGACIGTGIARFFPALGVGVLATLCVFGATLLLVIPGIIVFCMLYISTQVSVLERRGVMAALSRSRELTRGHKAEIFGLLFVLGLLNLGLSLIFKLAAGQVPGVGIDAAFHSVSRQLVINLVNSMISGSLGAVMASVAYYFLRAEKEGTSAAELAAIFD